MCSPGDDYIPFLEQAGCEPEVVAHCLAVRDVAIRIATSIYRTGTGVDLDLVAAGSVLHDIGRSITHGMGHADAGGTICRNLGLDDRICHIVERHIGAGLTADERRTLGLPAADRLPVTLEEKIVAHADNMVKGTRVISRDEFIASLERFPESTRMRFIHLAEELDLLSSGEVWNG